MAVCEICGNDYDKAFEVRAEGNTHIFDSFEPLLLPETTAARTQKDTRPRQAPGKRSSKQ